MPSGLTKIKILISLITVIFTTIYIYTFIEPINEFMLLEWSYLSEKHVQNNGVQGEILKIERHHLNKVIYQKFSTPFVSEIPINFLKYERTFTILITWHSIEIFILLLFQLYFLLTNSIVVFFKQRFLFLEKFSLTIVKIIDHKYLSFLTKLAGVTKIGNEKFLMMFLFVLFICVQFLLRHHGAKIGISNEQILLLNIATVITTATMLLSVFHIHSNPVISNRRKFLAQVGFGTLFTLTALSPIVIEKLFQVIHVGHILKPRFRTKNRNLWHKVFITPGLYQHIKNNKLYFVNDSGFVRCNNKPKTSHLMRVHIKDWQDTEYSNMPKLTASVYFETWSLRLLNKGKLLDALNCLEAGCKYEIYRIRMQGEKNPNIRIFKLYSGLCRKFKVKHNLLQLKNEVLHDKLLVALLHPFPQRWLMSRAWSFKHRWTSRKSYNGVTLTIT